MEDHAPRPQEKTEPQGWASIARKLIGIDISQITQGKLGLKLWQRAKSQPMVLALVLLVAVTLGGLVIYPRASAPQSKATALGRSGAATPTSIASPAAKTSVLEVTSTPASQRPSGITPVPIGSTPALSGRPTVPTPTPPTGIAQVPPPPPAPTPTPLGFNSSPSAAPTSRPNLPPQQSQTINPPTGSTPIAPVPSPTATFTPSATSTPTATPTPGPVTLTISVPNLAGGTGYYYVINTSRAGDISATWKFSGGSGQLFLYKDTPYGQGSGQAGSPKEGYISFSGVGGNGASIPPLRVEPGNYTLYFYSGALNTLTTSSASVTYIGQPDRGATATPSATSTPVATPTATPRATATPSPTP